MAPPKAESALMLLQIEKTEAPRGFRLVGELDASNVGSVAEALDPVLQEGGDLTLDLPGLAFMDSTGIQVLVRSAKHLGERGRLILMSPGSLVKRILNLIPVEKLENVSIVDED
jgi:anti-anti-sigma factor